MALTPIQKASLTVMQDRLEELIKSVRALQDNYVMVGIPAETAERDDEDTGLPAGMNNAAIGYLMEHGSPVQNIPARAFLRPGVEAALPSIVRQMERAARYALAGQKDDVIKQFHAMGITTVSKIKAGMRAGIQPPLSVVTLRKRVNRNTITGRAGSRKGAALELASRAAGNAPSTEYAKPLIDTRALLNSITYVLRGKWF